MRLYICGSDQGPTLADIQYANDTASTVFYRYGATGGLNDVIGRLDRWKVSAMNVKTASKNTERLRAAAFFALIIAFGLWKDPISNSRDLTFANFLVSISPYVVATAIAAINLVVSLRRPFHLFWVFFSTMIAVGIAMMALSAFRIL